MDASLRTLLLGCALSASVLATAGCVPPFAPPFPPTQPTPLESEPYSAFLERQRATRRRQAQLLLALEEHHATGIPTIPPGILAPIPIDSACPC